MRNSNWNQPVAANPGRPENDGALADVRRTVRLASRPHDVVALHVHDQPESELPGVRRLPIKDAETGELDAADASVRHRFAVLAKARVDELRRSLASEGVDSLKLNPRKSDEPAPRTIFKNRAWRMQQS